MKVLIGIALAWAAAWAVVILNSPSLAVVAGLGFLQNLAFTFVSRGRNSGSLVYHMVAAAFSNGIFIAMFAVGWRIMETAPDAPWAFLAVYTLSTMSGSVFAHWIARRSERGKARNVQEDRVEAIEKTLRLIDDELDRKHTLMDQETELRAAHDKILRDAIRQNNEKIGALENHVPDLDAAYKRIAELEKRLHDVAGAADKHAELTEKHWRRINELEAEDKKSEEILVLQSEILDRLEKRLDTTSEDRAILRRQIEAGNDRFGKLEGTFETFRETVDALGTRTVDHIRRVEERLDNLELDAIDYTEVTTGLASLAERVEQLEEDRGRAFQRLENHLVAIDGLRRKIEEVKQTADAAHIHARLDGNFQWLTRLESSIEDLQRRDEGSKTVAGVDGARINVLNKRVDNLHAAVEGYRDQLRNLESLTLDRIDALERKSFNVTLPVMEGGKITGYFTTNPGDCVEPAEERLKCLEDTVNGEIQDLHAAFEKEVRRSEEDIRRLDWLTSKIYAGEVGSTPLIKDVVRELECDVGNLEDRVKELEEGTS